MQHCEYNMFQIGKALKRNMRQLPLGLMGLYDTINELYGRLARIYVRLVRWYHLAV